jgi:hypothetical protein
MARRPIARTLVAAAGGLLGVACLSDAVAFADSFDIDPVSADAFDASSYTYDPVAPETVTGLYNMATAPPGVNESIQGYQLFNVYGSDLNTSVGTFYAYESTAPYLTPYVSSPNYAFLNSEVLYISPDAPGYTAPAGTAPTAGSLISISHSVGGEFENIYSAIPSGGTETVTDTLETPSGSFDLSPLVNSLGFDAANVTPALPDDDGITGVDRDPTIVAVNGLPPLTIALQGTQEFDYKGNPFSALETTTEDGLGFHTEAFLVTATSSNPDSLPVGSIYNTIDYDNLQNVYSSIPQADGPDKITDTLLNTTTGQITDLSSLFATSDASLGLDDGSSLHPIAFGDSTIHAVAGSQETFTGINGLPPGNASIQGTDTFGIYSDNSDTPSTTFTGDVTNVQALSYSNYAESLLVTDSTDPAVPDGSVIDMTTYGNGVENIYTDLAATTPTGHGVITDTLVTPLGNLDLSPPSLDASAGLNPLDQLVSFIDTAWLDLLHMF